jgi:hypothetical protein
MRPGVVVIGSDDMDAVDWGEVNSGSIYLDVWGKVHLELNSKGYMLKLHNANPWDVFVRQERYFAKLPLLMLGACLTKRTPDLIGALQFIYYRKQRMLLNSNVGILSWEYMQRRGDPVRNSGVGDVRRGAFRELFGTFDEVGERLGAGMACVVTATIAEEKMRAVGFRLHETGGFAERFQKFVLTFPFRNTRMYLKPYGKKNS